MNRVRLTSYLLPAVSLIITLMAQADPTPSTDSGDISAFQIRASDELNSCLVLKPDVGEDRSEVIEVIHGSCAHSGVLFWTQGENHRLLQVVDNGDENQSSWCLTRSSSSQSGEILSVRPCYDSDNEAQSWGFDTQGRLYRYKAGEGRSTTVPVIEKLSGTEQGVWKGSFQWVHDNPERTEWCYTVPWLEKCNRICASTVPQPDCNPDDSGQPDPIPTPTQPETEPDPTPGQKPDPVQPEPEAHPVSKKAGWFVLKQVRTDDNICLEVQSVQVTDGNGESVTVKRVGLQPCVPGESRQQWAHNLFSKQIFNKDLEDKKEDSCLTKTKTDIRMTPCLGAGQTNRSQMWYFSRGWTSGVSYAALLSYTDGGDNWKYLLNNIPETSLNYWVLPRYDQDCERVKGKCYDLVNGKLQDNIPFYSH